MPRKNNGNKKGKGNNIRKDKGLLGRALINDRFKNHDRSAQVRGDDEAGQWLHTTDLNDGLTEHAVMSSITEQSSLDDFLATAALADRDFTADRQNISIVDMTVNGGPSNDTMEKRRSTHAENQDLITVPRRPDWDETTTRQELHLRERQSFLEWRRGLAQLEEKEHVLLTPFERNIEVWRQLWRVVERSHVVVQIVDARNPMLFFSSDLAKYVGEQRTKKECVLLVNKADMLTQNQRLHWARSFSKLNIKFLFWSAYLETKRQEEVARMEREAEAAEVANNTDLINEENVEDANDDGTHDGTDADSDGSEQNDTGDAMELVSGSAPSEEAATSGTESNVTVVGNQDEVTNDDGIAAGTTASETDGTPPPRDSDDAEVLPGNDGRDDANEVLEWLEHEDATTQEGLREAIRVLNADEILKALLEACPSEEELLNAVGNGVVTKDGRRRAEIGLVGYPNVGKSSTINALVGSHKVAVAATPGKTKHFQTIALSDSLALCDCPGLVFPSFASTKADMVCNGVLPIDQLRDHLGPMQLVAKRIEREVLDKVYGLNIIKPMEGESPNRAPTAHEILVSFSYMRGFMTAHGSPDEPRGARYILKDYVNGKILYCHPPEGVNEMVYNKNRKTEGNTLYESRVDSQAIYTTILGGSKHKPEYKSDIDTSYLGNEVKAIVRGVTGMDMGGGRVHHKGAGNTKYTSGDVVGKPWKKHKNKPKEKTRRVMKEREKGQVNF